MAEVTGVVYSLPHLRPAQPVLQSPGTEQESRRDPGLSHQTFYSGALCVHTSAYYRERGGNVCWAK